MNIRLETQEHLIAFMLFAFTSRHETEVNKISDPLFGEARQARKAFASRNSRLNFKKLDVIEALGFRLVMRKNKEEVILSDFQVFWDFVGREMKKPPKEYENETRGKTVKGFISRKLYLFNRGQERTAISYELLFACLNACDINLYMIRE
jgi:hypothetical protein